MKRLNDTQEQCLSSLRGAYNGESERTSRIGRVLGLLAMLVFFVTGCASVPLASAEADAARKRFDPPADGKAGVYVYRDSFVGQALKKTVSMDGKALGATSNKVYFFKEVEPGPHIISTQSEFGDNSLDFNASPGLNHFFEQYIKMGVFVGGANIKAVSESEGKAGVLRCKLAQ
jgi:hypothetical protein